MADWLNACHIDTPVVSAMGPQRHNGIVGDPRAVQLPSVSICPQLLILLLVDITCMMILCDCDLFLQRRNLLLFVCFTGGLFVCTCIFFWLQFQPGARCLKSPASNGF